MNRDGLIGKRRRSIEDSIVQRYYSVHFAQQHYAWLEEEHFWDYVFSWYELVKYYEDSGDNTIGAHMLELFAHCSKLFRQAATDGSITERRRDKAADALYQMTYYVNQMAIQVRRNGIEQETSVGEVAWKRSASDESALN